MAVAFVQKGSQFANGTTCQVTLTGVTAGNALIAFCLRQGATDRTLTVSDDRGNSWADALAETVSGSREVQISRALSVAAGDTVITLTASGTTDLGLTVFEVSGLDASPDDAQSTSDAASGTSKVCAAAGAIDTSADVFIVCGAVGTGDLGTVTYPANFTSSTLNGLPSAAKFWSAHRVSAGALTDEDADWSHTTDRATLSAIASFKGAAAPAVDPRNDGRLLIQQSA